MQHKTRKSNGTLLLIAKLFECRSGMSLHKGNYTILHNYKITHGIFCVQIWSPYTKKDVLDMKRVWYWFNTHVAAMVGLPMRREQIGWDS